jgi:hypothetical protein
MLQSLAEGIILCKMDQINADPTGNWYRLVQKKIELQTARVSVLKND